jgi:tRNA-splicing ligase RtcB (3'-phosphate/5'-hydroxy nucleic acid ligase)
MTKLIYGNHDEATLQQIDNVLASGAEYFVECADGHLGYSHPIGGVAAYRNHISLSGVGFDIGCGNTAVRTNLKGEQVRPRIAGIMDEVFDKISFGVGRKRGDGVEYGDTVRRVLDGAIDAGPAVVRGLRQLAHDQVGTVGSGNHYVDIFVEEATDEVWVGVHFGSRGLGHKIATHYMKEVGAKDSMMAPPALLEVDSELGREYLTAMLIAGQYAKLGRDLVVDAVCKILGAVCTTYVNNHHNFAWKETHFGQEYWIVRKGATPAFPNQLGFIGGSMGDDAVIVEGVECTQSKAALRSTVHGAGRIMSRTAARGKFVKDEHGKKQRQPGLVRHDEMVEWLKNKGVVVRGGDLDEAPQAYRRLPEVLSCHAPTINVLHTLSPIGVAMAGSDVQDPYKD